MSVSERISPEIRVIDANKHRMPTITQVDDEGVLCLKLAPGVVVRGTRAELQDWFGQGIYTLADSFWDDLEAEVRRDQRFAIDRQYGRT